MTDYKSPLPTNQGSTKLSEISVDTSSTLLGADAHDSALRVTEQILKITADLLRRQNYFLRSSGVINWNTSNQIEFSGSDIYMDILQTENATQPLISLVLQASDFTSIEVLDGEILYLELDSTLISTLGSTIVIENGLSGGGTEGKRVKKGTSMPTIVSPIDGLSISTTYCLPIAYAKGSVVHWVPHGITWPAGTTSRLGAVIVEGQEPYQDFSVSTYTGSTTGLIDRLNDLSLTGGIILVTTSISIPTGTTLRVPDNVKIIGRGPKSELVLNGNALIKLGKNADLENLKITAAADFTGNAIHMDAADGTYPCQRASLTNVIIDMSAAVDTPLINSWNYNAVDGGKISGSFPQIFAKQSTGKILMGGSFTSYGGISGRSYLVRLNADGTVDEDFCTKAVDSGKFNGGINAIVVDSSDNIYIGGGFTNYKATGRNYLVKLDSAGNLASDGFNAAVVDGAKFNSNINALAISGSVIYVGGNFTSYNGSGFRNYMMSFNTSTGADGGFSTWYTTGTAPFISYWSKFNAEVKCIKISGSTIFIGGAFTNFYGLSYGNSINYFVATSLSGSINSFTYNASRLSTSAPYFNNWVMSIEVDSSNNVYVGGYFTDYKTSGRNRLVKLDSAGNMSTTFNTNAVDTVRFNNVVGINSIGIDSSDNVYVGGQFTNYKATGRSYLVKLDSAGNLASDTFNANAVETGKFNSRITCVKVLDNKIYAGGLFTSYLGGTGRNYAVRLNSDGTTDANLLQSAVTVTGIKVEANNCRINHCWFKGVASAAQRTGINYVAGYTDNADVDSLFE